MWFASTSSFIHWASFNVSLHVIRGYMLDKYMAILASHVHTSLYKAGAKWQRIRCDVAIEIEKTRWTLLHYMIRYQTGFLHIRHDHKFIRFEAAGAGRRTITRARCIWYATNIIRNDSFHRAYGHIIGYA